MPNITIIWMVFGFDGGGTASGVGVGRGERVGSGVSVSARLTGAVDS